MNMDFYISIAVGVTQAFMYNPIDKAIHNSIINNTKLFNKQNWNNPFTGAANGSYARIITGGLYFYLIDKTKNMNTYQSALYVSMATSLIINPFNVVKYKSYANNLSNYDSVKVNYKKYGFKFGIIGLEALIIRDFVFNVIYLKCKNDNNNLIHNCGAICMASVVSSPFHFARNMKYHNNDSYIKIYKDLFQSLKSTNKKISYTMKQFAIGHGTLRTVMGLYTGQVMYSTLKELAH